MLGPFLSSLLERILGWVLSLLRSGTRAENWQAPEYQPHLEPAQYTPPPSVTSQLPSLFAVVIGINEYKDDDIPNLGGAVADADAIHQFLLSRCGAAMDRIVNLRNKEATKDAIVQAIKNLAEDPRITAKDPIFIYYAGHGSQAKSPLPNWETSSKDGTIQMLLPHDFVRTGSKDHRGQGIFDLKLSNVLADIAQRKSDNITVILDCCHSGSGTRIHIGLNETNSAFRGIELPPEYVIPPDVLIQNIAGNRGSAIPQAQQKTGLRSHVLLAACMQGETAGESQGRGVFTSALLALLEQQGVDQLTYQEIIMSLPILNDQNPQCEGVNQQRILFNTKPSNYYRKHYIIRPSANKQGEYTMSAGCAHGVTEMAKFDVYSNAKMSSPPLGSIEAIKVDEFSAQCSSLYGKSFPLLSPAYAIQTRTGIGHDVHIYIDTDYADRELLINILEDMKTNHGRSYYLSRDIDDRPDLSLQARNSNQIQFDIMDKLCREYGLTRMPFDNVPINNSSHLTSVFCGASDFYRNLHHSRRVGLPSLSAEIEIECFKLVSSGEYTDDLDEILIPEQGGQNLNVNGKILIDVDEKNEYGYRIKNNSSFPLHAALFYFDMSDLSISSYYLPGTALQGNVDFSLLPQGSLSIGFGDSGTPPRVYEVKENENIDVGYLKLYLSTQYVDYSHIAQQSPFSPDRGYRPFELRPLKKDSWDTLTIPIVQQKFESRLSETQSHRRDHICTESA